MSTAPIRQTSTSTHITGWQLGIADCMFFIVLLCHGDVADLVGTFCVGEPVAADGGVAT